MEPTEETKPSDEKKDRAPADTQQLVDLGSSTIKTRQGTIHTLTIVGQIEGHQLLPDTVKTTKYEHVMPLLATVEESDEEIGRAHV